MFSKQVPRILVFLTVVGLSASTAVAQHNAVIPRIPDSRQTLSSQPQQRRTCLPASQVTHLIDPCSAEQDVVESRVEPAMFAPVPTPNQIFDAPVGCGTAVVRPTCQCVSNYCCDPCRAWTVRAGAMFLHRGRPGGQLLFSDPAVAGSGVNADDFNPGWGTGVDVSLIQHRTFQTDNDLELRFFGVDSWSDTQSSRLNGNPLIIHNTPPTFITGGRDISSHYSLSLMNTELNLRRRMGSRWTALGGFRHVQFNEELNTRLLNGPGVGDIHYNVNANNDLFGLQAGLLYDLSSSCDCCVQLYGKAGIYANHATQFTSLTNFSAPVAMFTVDGGTTQLAGVGEVGVSGSKRLWKNLALRGAYQVFVLDGVATAPGQISASSFVSQSGLGNSDTVIFHGATVGLEWTY